MITTNDWSVKQVASWVKSITGSETYSGLFQDEEIDGGALLLLSNEDLKELLPKMGPRKKLQHALEELKTRPVTPSLEYPSTASEYSSTSTEYAGTSPEYPSSISPVYSGTSVGYSSTSSECTSTVNNEVQTVHSEVQNNTVNGEVQTVNSELQTVNSEYTSTPPQYPNISIVYSGTSVEISGTVNGEMQARNREVQTVNNEVQIIEVKEEDSPTHGPGALDDIQVDAQVGPKTDSVSTVIVPKPQAISELYKFHDKDSGGKTEAQIWPFQIEAVGSVSNNLYNKMDNHMDNESDEIDNDVVDEEFSELKETKPEQMAQIQGKGKGKQPKAYSKSRKLSPYMKCMQKKKRAGNYGLLKESKRIQAKQYRDAVKLVRQKSPQFDQLMKMKRSWNYKRQKAKSQAERLEAEKQCRYFSDAASKMYEILKAKYPSTSLGHSSTSPPYSSTLNSEVQTVNSEVHAAKNEVQIIEVKEEDIQTHTPDGLGSIQVDAQVGAKTDSLNNRCTVNVPKPQATPGIHKFHNQDSAGRIEASVVPFQIEAVGSVSSNSYKAMDNGMHGEHKAMDNGTRGEHKVDNDMRGEHKAMDNDMRGEHKAMDNDMRGEPDGEESDHKGSSEQEKKPGQKVQVSHLISEGYL